LLVAGHNSCTGNEAATAFSETKFLIFNSTPAIGNCFQLGTFPKTEPAGRIKRAVAHPVQAFGQEINIPGTVLQKIAAPTLAYRMLGELSDSLFGFVGTTVSWHKRAPGRAGEKGSFSHRDVRTPARQQPGAQAKRAGEPRIRLPELWW
jgi:hypothetical protein